MLNKLKPKEITKILDVIQVGLNEDELAFYDALAVPTEPLPYALLQLTDSEMAET